MVEKTRHKYRKVRKLRPNLPAADFNRTSSTRVDYIFGEGRNEMGFEGKPKRPPGPPLKCEGKRLEDGDARDKSVIVRGFGSLPTRGDVQDPLTRSRRRKR